MLCNTCANPCKYGYHYDCPNYKSKYVEKKMTMLNPLDSEFLSQELRETWKKVVEELEKENKILQEEINAARDYIKWCDDTISILIEERNGLEEAVEMWLKQPHTERSEK